MGDIADRLKETEASIASACERSNREKTVHLIAVSKTKPIPLLLEAYEYGIREFGENRVQELKEKAEALPQDICWHLIGHLQKNKVRQAVRYASLIHSVDSVALAAVIDEEAKKQSKTVSVLLEVNVSKEESKFGFSPDEVLIEIEELARLTNIRIKGLMTIAPFTKTPESNRIYFKKLRQLAVDIGNKNIDNVSMDVLSMGMSGDYEIAIEEGATMVRVGTAIFGKR